MNLSIPAIGKLSEEEAWELLEDIRWAGRPVCPHCANTEKSYLLKPQSGYRTLKSGKTTYRRVWKCGKCRKQYSVLVGTIFHGSHIPLGTWLTAIRMMCGGKNGVSAHELHRSLDITYKTAWFMCHRIREAMKLPPLAGKLSGVVEADETWIGGKPRAGQVKNRKEASAFRDKKAGGRNPCPAGRRGSLLPPRPDHGHRLAFDPQRQRGQGQHPPNDRRSAFLSDYRPDVS
jgi:transposase-like protein